ncbi:MAG: arylsulfatase [Bacteroidota bacterium]
MKYLKIVFLVALLSSAACSLELKRKEAQDQKRNLPNIVYILADDLGYGDLSSLNPKSAISTPNMDGIVNEGIHFTDTHSNSSVCTPTRYGVLTGRYAWRSPLKTGVLWGYDSLLIERDRLTVPSYLKDNGYTTACIGKWHLGLGWQAKDETKPIVRYSKKKHFKKDSDSNVDFSKSATGPNDIGFDYSYIIPSSLDIPPYVYLENGKVLEWPTAFTPGKRPQVAGRGIVWRAGEKSPSFDFNETLDHFSEKAIHYISSQKENKKPFFLYFPITAPHTPWLPGQDFVGKSEAGRYGDFVTHVDQIVGMVIDALDQNGLTENTLIIVTSDNGAHWTENDKNQYAHRPNHNARGQKGDIYEGGHHIPYIAKWPGKIKPRSSSDQLMCTTDLLATVASIVGKPLTKGGEDSYDMLDAYLGRDTKPIRDHVIHHSLRGTFAIRKGKWKYTEKLGSGGFTKPFKVTPEEGDAPATLFNLEKDYSETTNLYNQHPEIVEELASTLEKVRRHLE